MCWITVVSDLLSIVFRTNFEQKISLFLVNRDKTLELKSSELSCYDLNFMCSVCACKRFIIVILVS